MCIKYGEDSDFVDRLKTIHPVIDVSRVEEHEIGIVPNVQLPILVSEEHLL